MSFTLPASVKPVSTSTAKLYKSHLNRLSAFGLDSVETILQNPEDVVTAIDLIMEMEDGTVEEVKHKARVYYSAVFYALYGQPLLSDPVNPLRLGFQKFAPSLTSTGEKWMTADKFKSQNK